MFTQFLIRYYAKTIMWLPFQTGLPVNEKTNSWTCYLSPEVYQCLKGINSQPEYVLVKDHGLFKIQPIAGYERNRLYIEDIPDDVQVHLKLVNSEIGALVRVNIEAVLNGDPNDCLVLLEDIDKAPVSEGQVYQLSNGLHVTIQKCYPFQRGLWCRGVTEILVSWVQPKKKELSPSLLKYSLGLHSGLVPLLFHHFQEWKANTFTHSVSEIPTKLAETIIEELPLSTFRNISCSHTAFIHHQCKKAKVYTGTFKLWPHREMRLRLIGNVKLLSIWFSFCTLGGASKLFVYKQSSLRSQYAKTLFL